MSEPPSAIVELCASRLSDAIRQRQIGCREVMEAYLAQIDAYNPVYNAIVNLRDKDELLAEADRADEELVAGIYRGWMHGMPHAVKDMTDVKGMVTSMGYRGFVRNIARADSWLVGKIRAAGAIFIGKTNTPEFGLGSQTYNALFGATGCAWNPAMTAGGSSGGAACALGAHMVPVADGSDMMGSLRNPAAYNNVIGFRPSFGRVPGGGDGDVFYRQLPVSGPMGRNVEDTIRLFATMAGRDEAFPLSMSDALLAVHAYKPTPLKDVRIGWMGNYDGYLGMAPGVLELCEASLKTLQSLGAKVEPVRPDFAMERLWEAWLTLRHWGANERFALYRDPETRLLLKPEAIFEIEGALNLTGRDVFDACAARSDWYRALNGLFQRFDFLILPSAQVFPFPKEVHWPDEIDGRKMDTYHRWMEVVVGATMAGVPTVNLPVGFSDKRLPMGMQVLGAHGKDVSVLEFALAYEQATEFLAERPRLVAR